MTPEPLKNPGENPPDIQQVTRAEIYEIKETEPIKNSEGAEARKSIFSINQQLGSLNSTMEIHHLPEDPLELDKVLEIWDECAEWVRLNKNAIHADQMKTWKPVEISGNRITVHTPSLAVESLIKDHLETYIDTFRKKLNNFAIEFIFERVETKPEQEADRSIPENFKKFKFLMDKYPEVRELVKELELFPTEM